MTNISRISIGQQTRDYSSAPVRIQKEGKQETPVMSGDQVILGQADKSESIIKTSFHESETCRIGKGYDRNFLGDDVLLPLPEPTGPAADQVLDIDGKGKKVRDYTHFSIVMHKDRKMAMFTANNIDGNQLRTDIGRSKWKIDDVVGEKNQLGPYVYKNNPLDRGHLVRRIDVVWGDKRTAQIANSDTFHYTNAVPQHSNLNQKKWLDLEDWLLNNAANKKKKVSVFTGPVLRENDKKYRGAQIPEDFWKIIILRKEKGELVAAGFMMSQKNMIGKLREEEGQKQQRDVPTEEIAPYQVTLESIEKMTNLDFGDLKDADAYSIYKTRQEQPFTITSDGRLLAKEASQGEERHYIHSAQDIII